MFGSRLVDTVHIPGNWRRAHYAWFKQLLDYYGHIQLEMALYPEMYEDLFAHATKPHPAKRTPHLAWEA